MAETSGKQALGRRGLSSLLNDISDNVADPFDEEAPTASEGGGEQMPIDRIEANEDQPRRRFPPEDLEELAASIRTHGVLQPILVRPSPGRPGLYQIIAGERRWRAAQIARLHEVPVIIRDFDDVDTLEVALIENVQRSDLNAVEEAEGYRQLIERYGYTHETLAQKVGKSRAYITNLTRMLALPEDVLGHVHEGALSAGHARALINAADPSALARKIVKEKLSVREAEKAAKSHREPPKGAAFRPADDETKALEAELSMNLQMRVSIRHRGEQGGELSISYRTIDDLEELKALLCPEDRPVYATG